MTSEYVYVYHGHVSAANYPTRQAATDAAFSLFSGPVGGLVVRPA